MEIILHSKRGNKELHRIVNYEKLTSNTSALLVFESEIELSEGNNAPYFEVRPIQFIAACETDNRLQFIGAFYISEYTDLACYVVSDLPNSLVQERQAYLVDYKSYADICKLTGETPLSFVEYVKVQRQAHSSDSTNTYIVVDDQWLHTNQQAEQLN